MAQDDVKITSNYMYKRIINPAGISTCSIWEDIQVSINKIDFELGQMSRSWHTWIGIVTKTCIMYEYSIESISGKMTLVKIKQPRP